MWHRAQLKVSDTQTIWLLFSLVSPKLMGERGLLPLRTIIFIVSSLGISPPTKWNICGMRATLKGKALVLRVCPHFPCNFGPNGFPQPSVSAIKRTHEGDPTRRSALALGPWSPQLWLTGNPHAQSSSSLLRQLARLLLFYSATTHGSHSKLEKPLSGPTLFYESLPQALPGSSAMVPIHREFL